MDSKSYMIAQTVQPQPTTTLPPPSTGDYTTSIVLSVVSAVGVIGLAGSQLITKIGANAVDNRSSKVKQELSQDAAINDGYVRQADKSFEALIRLLDTSIGNILQTSRETKEIFYLGHEKTTANTEAITKLENATLTRLDAIEENLAKVATIQKDIMNVLNMKPRGV